MIDFEEVAKLTPSKRIKPLLIGLLPTMAVCALFVAICLLIASAAHAAVRPDKETLSVRPEAVTEEQKPKPRCFVVRTVIVTLKFPNGQIAIFPVTRAVAC